MTNKEVIFNSLSFGNLILAKRASNTKKISHGHRNGPFLVLENKDGVLSCLYATSNEQAESLLKISKNEYNLKKDTYITGNIRKITIDEFLTSIYYLNDKEKKDLIKTLYINGIEEYAFLCDPKLEVGDIVGKKSKYLIIDENDECYIAINANWDEVHSKYRFDCSRRTCLSKGKKYKRVAFLSDEEINACDFIKKKYKSVNSDAISKTLEVGNLVVYRNLFYYLYYELGDKKLSFSVSKNKTTRAQEITIDGQNYYANFGLKKDFDANQQNVLFVASATEEEKQLIKLKRNRKDEFKS